MTTGRPHRKGLDDALPVALKRGTVMSILQTGECVCDFIIIGKDQVVFVRPKKTG